MKGPIFRRRILWKGRFFDIEFYEGAAKRPQISSVSTFHVAFNKEFILTQTGVIYDKGFNSIFKTFDLIGIDAALI